MSVGAGASEAEGDTPRHRAANGVVLVMTALERSISWFDRVLLGFVALLMTVIAWRGLSDPAVAAARMGITLATPAATTVFRVGFGGFPLGVAAALVVSLLSTDRLRSGLVFVLAVVGAITAARIQGLVLDGETVSNLHLLAPEVTILALSTMALFLERRRGLVGGGR